jgi:hypothetical protein
MTRRGVAAWTLFVDSAKRFVESAKISDWGIPVSGFPTPSREVSLCKPWERGISRLHSRKVGNHPVLPTLPTYYLDIGCVLPHVSLFGDNSWIPRMMANAHFSLIIIVREKSLGHSRTSRSSRLNPLNTFLQRGHRLISVFRGVHSWRHFGHRSRGSATLII